MILANMGNTRPWVCWFWLSRPDFQVGNQGRISFGVMGAAHALQCIDGDAWLELEQENVTNHFQSFGNDLMLFTQYLY